jgi:hypothetical protein
MRQKAAVATASTLSVRVAPRRVNRGPITSDDFWHHARGVEESTESPLRSVIIFASSKMLN